jgi:hypothetical protein
MVNMPHGTDVQMRLRPLELFLGHGSSEPLCVANGNALTGK